MAASCWCADPRAPKAAYQAAPTTRGMIREAKKPFTIRAMFT
jgi:hypothetical protein